MSGFFSRQLLHSPWPWRVQCDRRGYIYDLLDRRVATIPKAGECDYPTRVANLAVIVNAPELLDRLIAHVAQLESMGVKPHPDTIALLNRCRPGAPPIKPDRDSNDESDSS